MPATTKSRVVEKLPPGLQMKNLQNKIAHCATGD